MTLLKDLIPSSIKEHIKKRIQGIDVLLNEKLIDFRGLLSDPFEALERAQGYPVLMNFKGSNCRGLQVLAFPINQKSHHPYVLTANEYLKGIANDFYSSSLFQFYQVFQPTNSAETIGLNQEEAPEILRNHVGVFKFPWESIPSISDVKERKKVPEIEGKENGVTLTWKDGDSMFGPVSSQKGVLEFKRISGLVDSIKINGYYPVQHIPGWLLVKEGNFKVLLKTGQHRAAVLAAFDDERIPVAIYPDSIIRRSQSLNWPWVRKGVLKNERALEIFDRIFNGEQPDSLKEVWPST